jgi:hypothetical protein
MCYDAGRVMLHDDNEKLLKTQEEWDIIKDRKVKLIAAGHDPELVHLRAREVSLGARQNEF